MAISTIVTSLALCQGGGGVRPPLPPCTGVGNWVSNCERLYLEFTPASGCVPAPVVRPYSAAAPRRCA
eukprot:366001-Chlamydomonas_euryale.AAC.8